MSKRTKYTFRQADDDRDVVKLPNYAPYSDVTKSYELLEKMNDFSGNFETLCRSFIKKTSPDHNNGSYFDAVIDKICQEAIEDIDLQRQEHIQLFSQSVAGYQKGIRIKTEAKLQMVIDAIRDIETELDRCNRIYNKGTSMEV